MTMSGICNRGHHRRDDRGNRRFIAARGRRAAWMARWAGALLLIGAGCSSQYSQESPSGAITTAPQGSVVLAPEALQGQWRKGCGPVARGRGGPALFDIVELRVTGADIHTHIRTFSDAACQVPYKYAANVTAHARLLAGAVIPGGNLDQVRAVDLATQPYSGAEFQPREFLAFAVIGERLYWSQEAPDRDGLSPQRRAVQLDFERPFQRL